MSPTTPDSSSHTLHRMLKESIHRFLTEHRNGVTDFSNFTAIFSRFLNNLPDPPLEFVWFYSALTFHSTKLTACDEARLQLSITKELFQLLVSCTSCTHNAGKKIAVLAPVVYELCALVFDKKCLCEEVESLLEGVVSYISMCCGAGFDENDECGALISCFVDLVGVWLVDKAGEDLRLFFPVVSVGVCQRMVSEGCGVGWLAGVVMSECFLLRLYLKFGCGMSRAELNRELRSSAVQMIKAFRSYYFFDTLLWMLLEPVLPTIPLVNYEGEFFLREVLYDVVTVVDFSFLGHEKGFQIPSKHSKNLAVTWLFVADSAVRFVRENGDPSKVISYLQAFSESYLTSQLIQWVMNQLCTETDTIIPSISTPAALIKWLLICKSRIENNVSVSKSEGKSLGDNHVSYTGNKGSDLKALEMVDTIDAMFLVVPELLKFTATDGNRKRKDGGNDDYKQVKFVKCHLNDNLMRETVLPAGGADGLSRGSEVNNPVSIDNVHYMEQ